MFCFSILTRKVWVVKTLWVILVSGQNCFVEWVVLSDKVFRWIWVLNTSLLLSAFHTESRQSLSSHWLLLCVTVLVHRASAGCIGVLFLICTWDSRAWMQSNSRGLTCWILFLFDLQCWQQLGIVIYHYAHLPRYCSLSVHGEWHCTSNAHW